MPANKTNIITNGKRVPLENRYPRYHAYRKGGIVCEHREDLRCQEGIVFDLLQRAGKDLLQGKGIIGFSLPVRMFEPRSTMERIADWWCTGVRYLTEAAHTDDPLERVKIITTFVISGLYTSAPQRKPFNPIIGETYQGIWPDGTSICMEHISHHPPISSFYVI